MVQMHFQYSMWRWSILSIILVAGCKREAATAPPTTRAQPMPSVTLRIDGVPVVFPLARILLQSTGAAVSVQISAASNTSPNSISLDLTLEDIDDPANLPGAEWTFRTEDSGREDTLNRIMLKDGAAVLEPVDVRILFGRENNRLTAEVDGEFRWYEPGDAESPLKAVTVTGKITSK